MDALGLLAAGDPADLEIAAAVAERAEKLHDEDSKLLAYRLARLLAGEGMD